MRIFSESEFYTSFSCGQYVHLNYNLFLPKESQAFASKVLKLFYHKVSLDKTLDIDHTINYAFSVFKQNFFIDSDTPEVKTLFTYVSNYIYSFIKEYPPGQYYLLYRDLQIPVSYDDVTIKFHYDLLLHDISQKKMKKIVGVGFHYKEDHHLQSNNVFIPYKLKILLNLLKDKFSNIDLTYSQVYLPRKKLRDLTIQSGNLNYKEFKESDINMNDEHYKYISIFKNNILFPVKPLCNNFNCKKRKDCLK